MARTKKQVDPKIAMVELLFGKSVTVEFAEKLLLPDWFENLEKHFKVEEAPVEPVKAPKNLKYKAMYEKLSGQVKKMNEVINKFETEEPVKE